MDNVIIPAGKMKCLDLMLSVNQLAVKWYCDIGITVLCPQGHLPIGVVRKRPFLCSGHCCWVWESGGPTVRQRWAGQMCYQAGYFFPALETRSGEGREALECRVSGPGSLGLWPGVWLAGEILASIPANVKMPKVTSQRPALFSLLRERNQTQGGKNGILSPFENFTSIHLL